MTRRLLPVALVLAVLLGFTAQARADLYSGTLSYGAGITTNQAKNNPWKSTDTTLQWNVAQQGSTFTYTYSWHADKTALSHIIIGVGSDATSSDFWGFTKSHDSLTTYKPGGNGNSNPGLPGDIYGFKFDGSSTSFTLSFTSDLGPIWGNFYAKGGQNYAYDSGFGQNGAQIAVPGAAPVPISSSLLLLTPGLAGLVLLRKRLR